MPRRQTPAADHDSPWKEALERYFRPFLALCRPQMETDIDWLRPVEFLDKELQKLVRQAKVGRRYVDKLVKVWKRTGEQAWVYLHVEVQHDPEPDFGERVFLYRSQLRLRHGKLVVCLAVLADDQPDWRPVAYVEELWDCSATISFPIVKLLDFEARRSELEASDNPFAIVILAHLDAAATKRRPQERKSRKLQLIRALYQRGFSREDVLELFRLIDWLMALPEPLEDSFWTEVAEIAEEQKMPFVSTGERVASRKGREQGLVEGRVEGRVEEARAMALDLLTQQFGELPAELRQRLEAADPDTCRELLSRAWKSQSLAELLD